MSDAVRDAFFGDLYRRTTESLLTPAMSMAEVRSFVALAKLPPGARVLDLGSGWGRHLPLLSEHGLRAVGLDRSLPYLKTSPGPVTAADLRALPFAEACFDAVGCFYSSLFFFSEDENLAALREVARTLRRGGVFVLQTANPIHLRRTGEEHRTLTLPDGARVTETSRFHLRAGVEELLRTVTLPDGSTIEGEVRVRHYAPGELEVLGLRAGFKLERFFGDLSHGPYTRQSRELVAVLRRT